jgi:hypothetical protein
MIVANIPRYCWPLIVMQRKAFVRHLAPTTVGCTNSNPRWCHGNVHRNPNWKSETGLLTMHEWIMLQAHTHTYGSAAEILCTFVTLQSPLQNSACLLCRCKLCTQITAKTSYTRKTVKCFCIPSHRHAAYETRHPVLYCTLTSAPRLYASGELLALRPGRAWCSFLYGSRIMCVWQTQQNKGRGNSMFMLMLSLCLNMCNDEWELVLCEVQQTTACACLG